MSGVDWRCQQLNSNQSIFHHYGCGLPGLLLPLSLLPDRLLVLLVLLLLLLLALLSDLLPPGIPPMGGKTPDEGESWLTTDRICLAHSEPCKASSTTSCAETWLPARDLYELPDFDSPRDCAGLADLLWKREPGGDTSGDPRLPIESWFFL